MYGKKPSVRHWGVFGQDAYYHVPKEQRAAFSAKMEPCIYLGHDPRQNCPTVYILRTGKVIRTRDVTYRSNSFKYGIAVREGQSAIEAAMRDGTASIPNGNATITATRTIR